MPDEKLPIETFMRRRCDELGLAEDELLHRLGYRKMPKARDHLRQLYEGDLGRVLLIRRLPTALELPPSRVKQVIEATQRRVKEIDDANYRAAFTPHAVIVTERVIPRPIFAAAICGVDSLLRIDLDPAQPPDTFAAQAFEGLYQRLLGWSPWRKKKRYKVTMAALRSTVTVPAFGRPTGLIVNYTPDHAIRFDLDGKPVETLSRAKRIGQAVFSLKGRLLSREELDSIFGRVVTC